MISGTFTIFSFIFLRETYAPTILARKTKRLRKETNNPHLVSKLDHGLTPKDFFLRSIVRPAKLIIRSPIVLSTCIYMAIVYGYLYLLFTTFPIVFEATYHFDTGTVGLTYLGLGVGSLLGLTIFAALSDRLIKSKTAKAQTESDSSDPSAPRAQMKPEYRLPFLIPGAFLIPIGLFMYGWTAQHHVHWIAPIIATALIGIANMFIFMSINLYLVDAFTVYAASALAANAVFRSVMGAVLPLAGQQMYKTLGLGWGNSLLAFIAVGLVPVPFVLLRWGEWMRTRWQVSNL
jgi:MFS family permease